MGVMELRRSLMMMQKADVLPSAYQKIEWLGSDGYSYIDTGIYGSNNVEVELDFQLMEIKDSMFFGDRVSSGVQAYYLLIRGGTYFATGYDGKGNLDLYKNGSFAVADLQRHTIKINNENGYLDGEPRPYSSPTSFTTQRTLLIFRSHHMSDSALGMQTKVYMCRIKDNGVTVRDYIPCIRKADNEPGMYDTVTKTFFANAFRGNFIIPT